MAEVLPFEVARVWRLEESEIEQLADILLACVREGAGIGFLASLTRDQAVAFWRKVAGDVVAGRRALLAARDAGGVVGAVQLVLDLPHNQPHRADLVKLLVHERARRQGLGAALMVAAEQAALECGRTVLVLDAVTAGPASRLYERLGWVRVGVIPGYALHPNGRPCDATFYYRTLAGEEHGRG